MELVVVMREDADGTVLAVCPSLPCCVSRGRSMREVLRKHRDAVRAHVASVTDFLPGRVQFNVIHA